MVKIFVGRLVESVTKEQLQELFGKYGEVIDCEVLKNFGFVHMADKKEAEKAISELDKSDLEGQQINVEFSVTKVASAAKLFVGNLAEGTKSSELHKVFKKFGTVIECDVVKNFGFVHMSRESQAREAIRELNNEFELNGNKIRVQMARARGGQGGSGGGGRGDFHGSMGYGRGPMPGPRYDPYGYDDGYYDMGSRSRNFPRPGVGRLSPYETGMRRDSSGGARRGARAGPSYVRLLRERALLARRLISEREGASFRDSYSGGASMGNGSSRLSRGLDSSSAAYTDFAVDDFADLPLEDSFDLNGGALDRYGGPSGYGAAYGAY